MDIRTGSSSNSSKSYTISPHLSYGPDGCQVLTSQGRRCGEMRTLQIIQEFKNMYETKMKQIDAEAGGDCVQAKINLQQDWIRDLTEQNDMLVRVVEELELEAADRVTMLEEKLQQTSKCACEVMESYNDFSLTLLEDFQKMERMQSDVQNLLELIRRAKQEGNWDFDDLKFFGFDLDEVLNEKNNALNISIDNNNVTKITDQRDKLLKQKNKKIKELEEKLANLVHGGEAEDAYQFKNLSQQYSDLKKSMMDMREALTAEVANKHDTILSLRRDVQVLEEQCRKADQQTHFKDDIIKELRKEIKQFKQQQQNLSKNRTRSPCTLKNSNGPDYLQQHPDPSLSNVGDNLLALRNTEIIGDSVITQRLKEKVGDPCNQTIIYICENSSYLKKSKTNASKEANTIETKKWPEDKKAGGEAGDSADVEFCRNEFYKCHGVSRSLDNSRTVNKDVNRRSFDAYKAHSYGIPTNQHGEQQSPGNDFNGVDIFRNNDTSKNSLFSDSLNALHADLQSTKSVDASKFGLSDGFMSSKPTWIDSSTGISDLLNQRKFNLESMNEYDSKICSVYDKTQGKETKTDLRVCHEGHRKSEDIECNNKCYYCVNQKAKSTDFSEKGIHQCKINTWTLDEGHKCTKSCAQAEHCEKKANIHIYISEDCPVIAQNLQGRYVHAEISDDYLDKTNEIEAKYNEMFNCIHEVSNCHYKKIGGRSKDEHFLANTTNISFHDSEIKGSSSPYRVDSPFDAYDNSNKTKRLLNDNIICTPTTVDDTSKLITQRCSAVTVNLPPKECPGSSHICQKEDNFESQSPVKLCKEKLLNHRNVEVLRINDAFKKAKTKSKELSVAENLQKRNCNYSAEYCHEQSNFNHTF